jgi:hypothetical protein
MSNRKSPKSSQTKQTIQLLPFDKRASDLPPMPADVFNELVGDMMRRGFRPEFPIITHNGKIIAGVHRARAAVKAGVEPVYQTFDGEDEDVGRFIIQADLCRRHLNPKERREEQKKLLKMYPEWTNRAISKVTGFDDKTVDRDRKELEANAEIPHKARVEKSGRKARGRKPGSGGKSPPKPPKKITLTTAEYTKVDSPAVEPKPSVQPEKVPSPDSSIGGVPEIPASPEKLTSDVPKGLVGALNPNNQASVAETRTQPATASLEDNPITVAWRTANHEQRLEYAEAFVDYVAAAGSGEDRPTRFRIWRSCKEIESGLNHLEGKNHKNLFCEYESLADQLNGLEDKINNELAVS